MELVKKQGIAFFAYFLDQFVTLLTKSGVSMK